MTEPKTPADWSRFQNELNGKASGSIAIERVQTLAKYNRSGHDFGIPWDLFESYVTALDRTQVISVDAHESCRSGVLAAPVTLNGGRTCFCYPVIK